MTKPHACSVLVLVGLVLGVLGGCGDDDEGEVRRRPVFTTGVTPTVTVSGLDDRDLRRVCESLDVYVDAEISFDSLAYVACLPLAIVTAGTPEGCKRELAECMAAFPEPVTIQAQLQDANVCFADLQSCNATVSDLESCLNVNLDLAVEILDQWTCDGAAQEDMQRAAKTALDTVSVCAKIDAGCQNFVDVI